MKSYDRSLIEIFSVEQAEHIQRIRTLTDSLEGMPAEARAGAIEEILRRAHTLKGASRAVGLTVTEQLAHRLETFLGRASETAGALGRTSLAPVHRGLDAMEDILAAAVAERPEPDSAAALKALGEDLIAPELAPDLPPAEPAPAAGPVAASPAGAELVRVNAVNIDNLIRASSQLVASVSAESAAQRQLDESARAASRALTDFLALRRACNPFLRAHEADLEAAPLRECLEFVDRELRSLSASARSSSAAQEHRAWELQRRVTDLHENAVKVRMIPAESVFGSFGAMVRQIAQDEGKEVEFRAEGLEVQADRLVLQALKHPVMHLLRNAVSHGIESPEARAAAGKNAAGSVQLRIDAEGGRLKVSVEDDGQGLNVPAVRERAVALGLIAEFGAAAESQNEVEDLIFRPGFSTSGRVTNISGRGMGLSVVKETVDRLHGDIRVRTGSHRGLNITISAGLSISTQQVLLVESGGFAFGLPTRAVRELVRTRLTALKTLGGREMLAIAGEPVPVAHLSELLGLAAKSGRGAAGQDRDPVLPVVAMASGGQPFAIIVDRLVDEREAVVKDLGLPARAAGMTAGGIPLDDGRVAVLLNPAALLARFRDTARRQELRAARAQPEKSTHRILVVDDSLTTRSLEKSILEAHGFQVSVAVDGAEALEKLSEGRFDLVITDVVMPRMDGMQLLEQMKRQKTTDRIPVIMVTSMESKEHQQQGMALGADAYIVKRKFDQQELLRIVRQIL